MSASRSQSSTPLGSRTPPPKPQAPKPTAKWLSGFGRLTVVLFFLFWACFSFMEWNDKLIAPHIRFATEISLSRAADVGINKVLPGMRKNVVARGAANAE